MPTISNYICGHLISWSPNYSYFKRHYNYINKLTIACHWKQKRGLPACSKKGQVICDGKLVNFLKTNSIENVVAQLFKILVGND